VDELDTSEKNIKTVEDPVEHRMQGIDQIPVNPKAGLTFPSGLKSILMRSDPGVVMIGETRDFVVGIYELMECDGTVRSMLVQYRTRGCQRSES
jgi:Tfp pilus assembly pilus retraction ATPase PilT